MCEERKGGRWERGREREKGVYRHTHTEKKSVPPLVLVARLVLGGDSVCLVVPRRVVHGTHAFPGLLQVPG
jgi:hypothetical protein